MGERWEPFRAYNLDRARTPSVQAALGALMEQFGMPAIPPAELERIAVPTTLIWGRHDLATPLAVAEAASARYGWPLHVIEDCADDPPIEQPEAFLRALRTATGDGGTMTVAVDSDGRRVAPDACAARCSRPATRASTEATRLWNGMVDKTPALVVQPTGHGRRRGRGALRARARPPAVGARRRPQHRRHGAGRRAA